jgi:hypothetical protein
VRSEISISAWTLLGHLGSGTRDNEPAALAPSSVWMRRSVAAGVERAELPLSPGR